MYKPTEAELREMRREFLLLDVEEAFGKQAVYLLKNLTTKKEEMNHGNDA